MIYEQPKNMNDTKVAFEKEREDSENEVHFIDLLVILAKQKKLVFGMPIAAALVSAALSSMMPNVYSSSTKLLPPQQAQSGAAALLSQLGGMASVVGSGGGLKNPTDVYIAMLKSRTVADKLIQRFQLGKVYDLESPEKIRQALEGQTTISTGKDGLITIAVEGEDKKLVAQLANGYVDELLKLTQVLAITEASQRRKFFEQQLERAKNNLAKAEMTLKSTLDTRGVISVDSESRVIVETVGRLRAQVAAKEIQLGSMQAFVTPNNQEYKRAQEELNSLRSQLSKLENGSPARTESSDQIANKADGLENIKVLREVKYYEMLYELLAKQYEAARLEEAKDSSLIQVLDSAIEPERKSKPKRTLITLTGMLLGGVFGLVLAFVRASYQASRRDPEMRQRWQEVVLAWKGRR